MGGGVTLASVMPLAQSEGVIICIGGVYQWGVGDHRRSRRHRRDAFDVWARI